MNKIVQKILLGVIGICVILFGIFFYQFNYSADASLREALKNANPHELQKALSRGADINLEFHEMPVVYFWVYNCKNFSVSEEVVITGLNTLISHGADVNQTDSAGNTALHCAALYGKLKICQYLLKQGANPHQKNMYGTTVFYNVENTIIFDEFQKQDFQRNFHNLLYQ